MKLMAAGAVTVALIAGPARAQLRSVTAVRHWSVGGVTRVAIEVTGQFEMRSDRLHDPERLYFDILNAEPRFENRRRLFTEDLNDPQLKRVRVAETNPGVTRVVLELADGVEATTSQLTNPNRLMVELRRTVPPSDAPPPQVVSGSVPGSPPTPETAAAPPDSTAAQPAAIETLTPGAPPTKIEAVSSVDPPAASPAPTASHPPLTAENAKSAHHMSSGQNSLIRTLGLKINRVVIDPGHGGHDQGTMGPKGLLEKDLVLDVSLRLGKLIEERMGSEVIYTRTDDTFVPLEGRTALANEKKADLFLSIHANSSSATRVAGIETYYLNFTDSKDALDVAARENASSQKSVFELRDLIQKITLHDKAEESHEFASRIQSALYAFSSRSFPEEKNRGVRKAPFVVLIGANMPSVLAEIGFLSNPKEEALLKKPDYRQKLADALFRGLSRYAESLSHFQMALN
jgi:N-acetylmuramoyl-L-alanine amidase